MSKTSIKPRACLNSNIKKERLSVVSVFWLGLASTPLLAAEQEPQISSAESLLNWESLVQMTFALVIVLGIIVFLSVMIKRFSLLPGASSGMIKILGGLALNNKDRLLLIQVGEEQILISSSPGRVGKVHDMRTPVKLEQLSDSAKPETRSFASLLNMVTNRSI